MKTKMRLTACLAAGVLILGVSAGAAFGSANGYSAYKDAVMDLALQEKNFTLQAVGEVKVDDTSLFSCDVAVQQDGVNRSVVSQSVEEGEADAYHDTYLNGMETWFNDEDSFYYQEKGSRTDENLLGYDENNEMDTRLVNFLSLAADTVAGDLKNNVVQVGQEDGKRLYQVAISGSQVPSLVNAGLSLAVYSGSNADVYGQVTFEDNQSTAMHYYEKTTGKTLSDDLRKAYDEGYDQTFYEAHQTELEAIDEATGEMWAYYDDILAEKGGEGVLYVKADGSNTYYSTWLDYLAGEEGGEEGLLTYYVAKELTLNQVDCTFALDDQGRLTDTQVTATFQTTDAAGAHHTLTLTGTLTVSDYGTTQVQNPDVGERTKRSF